MLSSIDESIQTEPFFTIDTIGTQNSHCESPPEDSLSFLLPACLHRWHHEAEHGAIHTRRYLCRYVVWGRGPTLVLLPGMTSDALSMVMLMARLQSHFRCISYDYPEGESDGARLADYRHEDLVQDLFELINHLRVREGFLFGTSFGSTIALPALQRQPQRFARAILQDGFAHRPLADMEIFFANWCRYLPGCLGDVPLLEHLMEKNHRAPFLEREPERWDFFLQRQSRLALRAFASRVLMQARLDLRPFLKSIPHAVLLVCGDTVSPVSRRCAQELRQGLPDAAHAEIEKCGHQPHLTHPEILAEIVRQFLMPAA